MDTVFNGRTGEENTAFGLQRCEGFGVLGAAVFDVLGFVGDDAGEVDVGEAFFVADEGTVGGDDEVVGLGLLSGLDAACALVDEGFEVGGEFGGFAAPVFDEGGGADDEGGGVDIRPRSGRTTCFEAGNEGEGLEGFAEAHFVGEDAAELVGVEVVEPGDAGFLVGA